MIKKPQPQVEVFFFYSAQSTKGIIFARFKGH